MRHLAAAASTAERRIQTIPDGLEASCAGDLPMPGGKGRTPANPDEVTARNVA
jgi:hypothetical protein